MNTQTPREQVRDYVEYLKENGAKEIEYTASPVKPVRPIGPSPKNTSHPAPTVPAVTSQPAPSGDLNHIAQRIASCALCPLHKTRKNTVPGQGHPHPKIMFVGEGPGEDEDLQGLAFVGRAGQLLTRLITAMGLSREEVFIGNIVKCRPPGNRVPQPDEMAACIPYLREQITLLKPLVIVALGATAVKGLTGNVALSITRQRGQWLTYEGIPMMPTYHPAYLLRGGGDGAARYWEVWDDMVKVLQKAGLPVPIRNRTKS